MASRCANRCRWIGYPLQTATDGADFTRQYAMVVDFNTAAAAVRPMRAIPVKNNGVTLTGGAFNAGATLVVTNEKMALIVLISGSFAAQSAENLKFHGTLISPPNCAINNDPDDRR